MVSRQGRVRRWSRPVHLPAFLSRAVGSTTLGRARTVPGPLLSYLQGDCGVTHEARHLLGILRVDLPNGLWQHRREMRGALSMVAGGSGHEMFRWRSRLAIGCRGGSSQPLLSSGARVRDPREAPKARRPPVNPAPSRGRGLPSGSRRTLRLEPGHRASVMTLTGSLLLTGHRRSRRWLPVRALGMSGTLAGGHGPRASGRTSVVIKMFSELKGGPARNRQPLRGTITGGTGR